jgi:hypothetical protein
LCPNRDTGIYVAFLADTRKLVLSGKSLVKAVLAQHFRRIREALVIEYIGLDVRFRSEIA